MNKLIIKKIAARNFLKKVEERLTDLVHYEIPDEVYHCEDPSQIEQVFLRHEDRKNPETDTCALDVIIL